MQAVKSGACDVDLACGISVRQAIESLGRRRAHNVGAIKTCPAVKEPPVYRIRVPLQAGSMATGRDSTDHENETATGANPRLLTKTQDSNRRNPKPSSPRSVIASRFGLKIHREFIQQLHSKNRCIFHRRLPNGRLIVCNNSAAMFSFRMVFQKSFLVWHQLLLLSCSSFLTCLILTAGDALDVWTWTNPPATTNTLYDVLYANGHYIAVGAKGSILESANGKKWISQQSHTTTTLFAVAFGNNVYVAVGKSGQIIRSLDGHIWVDSLSGVTSDISDIAYGNGIFVALTRDSKVLTSTDGNQWSWKSIPTVLAFARIAFGNGWFVANADSGFIISQNGQSWTSIAEDHFATEVSYVNNVYIAHGRTLEFSDRAMFQSTDLLNWTTAHQYNGPDGIGGRTTYHSGNFIDSYSTADETTYIATTQDFDSWNTVLNGSRKILAWSLGSPAAVAVGTYGLTLFSEDNYNWNNLGSPTSIIFANGQFIIGGSFGAIYSAADGLTWTLRRQWDSQSNNRSTFSAFASGAGKIIAVNGQNGRLASSLDGVTWSEPFSSNRSIGGIAYGLDKFWMTTSEGKVFSSTDGNVWNQAASVLTHFGSGYYGNGLACGNGKLVVCAGGADGGVYTSADGSHWEKHLNNVYLASISFRGGRFIALGSGVWTSLDGDTWTTASIPLDNCLLSSSAYGNEEFVIVGYTLIPPLGFIYSSTDGISWKRRPFEFNIPLSCVAYGNGTFIGTGIDGQVFECRDSSHAPHIVTGPASTTSLAFADVSFNVAVDGALPLRYQWRRNGFDLPGETGPSLTVRSVSSASSGRYSVFVENAFGHILSGSASLAVLTDGANGLPPKQISPEPPPTKPSEVDNLVVVTHGWAPFGVFQDVSWVVSMADAIRDKLDGTWIVIPYTWNGEGFSWASPESAINYAGNAGSIYGRRLAEQGWKHVHLIGHSAGSAFVEAVSRELKQGSPITEVHSTFLDPFLSFSLVGKQTYGVNATWSDCYFSNDWTGQSTMGPLDHSFNVDVTWVDPHKKLCPIYCASATANSTVPSLELICGEFAVSTHSYPREFYYSSIVGSTESCARDVGFALSKEGNGWNRRTDFSRGQPPLVLCGPAQLPRSPLELSLSETLNIKSLPQAQSSAGVDITGNSFVLSTHSPTWLTVGVAVSNVVNFVQFDACYTSPNAADGILTVYWNTNEIGAVHERAYSTNINTFRFALPSVETNGLFALCFRLDPTRELKASVSVSNVHTGFLGAVDPIHLGIAMNASNRIPTLMLTAAPNYNYLLERSTNLTDWSPLGLLVNTNGVAVFPDGSGTNVGNCFYRATLQ